MGKKLIEVEMEAEHLLLARHQLVENDRLRNGNREALTTLRRKAGASKKSGPSPFRSVMRELREQEIYKGEMPHLCSMEDIWMALPESDIFASVPFHVVHTILEKDQERLYHGKKKLQSSVKEKSFLISAARAMISFITLTDNKSK